MCIYTISLNFHGFFFAGYFFFDAFSLSVNYSNYFLSVWINHNGLKFYQSLNWNFLLLFQMRIFFLSLGTSVFLFRIYMCLIKLSTNWKQVMPRKNKTKDVEMEKKYRGQSKRIGINIFIFKFSRINNFFAVWISLPHF